MSYFSLNRPDLAKPLAEADALRQRKIVESVARLVFTRVPIHAAQNVLEALGAGRFGDSDFRESLLVSSRDSEAEHLALLEKLEDAEDAGEEIDPADEEKCSAEARVAAAFKVAYHALDADAGVAVQRVVYQGGAATSVDQVEKIVADELGIRLKPGPYFPG